MLFVRPVICGLLGLKTDQGIAETTAILLAGLMLQFLQTGLKITCHWCLIIAKEQNLTVR